MKVQPRPAPLFAAVLLALALVQACVLVPPGVRVMKPDELVALARTSDAPLLVDTRSPEEYTAGHVPGAINVPYRQVDAHLAELAPYMERGVVTYCDTGVRSARALRDLAKAGFTNLWRLEGDMSAWRAAGREVAAGSTRE